MKKAKRKSTSKKAERESALAVLEARMLYHYRLAQEEIALGQMGSRERIEENFKFAQEAARELAPFRHPKLTTSDPSH